LGPSKVTMFPPDVSPVSTTATLRPRCFGGWLIVGSTGLGHVDVSSRTVGGPVPVEAAGRAVKPGSQSTGAPLTCTRMSVCSRAATTWAMP
jgi:hypothetical protein